jgi:hypothetical protein
MLANLAIEFILEFSSHRACEISRWSIDGTHQQKQPVPSRGEKEEVRRDGWLISQNSWTVVWLPHSLPKHGIAWLQWLVRGSYLQ